MLSEKRKGEIALSMLKAQFEVKGVHLKPDSFQGDLEDISEKTGIPIVEISEVMEEIITELVAKAFNR